MSSVVVIGLSHRTAPVELRERFAIGEAKLGAALGALRESGLAREAVIVSTCNRVEIYLATDQDPPAAFAGLRRFLSNFAGHDGALEAEAYTLAEPQSLRHLFKVACGLDSMVLGETEVLGQLKQAYEAAVKHHATGPKLNRAFQRAFNAAKHVRTHTQIQRGSVSVASVAVELAEKIFSSLEDRQVLVIGAGDTSEKAARALLSRGARSIIVANRSHERAVALARELGGRAVTFDDWFKEFVAVDIVISSTSAPHYILDRQKLEPVMAARENRSLLLVDLAVPRDIDPAVNFLENIYLYNVDDLQTIADDYLRQRREEVARCDAIIEEKLRDLMESAARRPNPPDNRPALEQPS